MNKKRLSFLALGALALCMATPAAAETYQGSKDWMVRFDGSAMISNFKTTDLDEALSYLQPGDSAVFSVSLRNESNLVTEWYMTNEVLKSLEESQTKAKNGAYTYLLTYTDTVGNVQTLYSSDAIGGTKDQAAGVGLHEATDSLENFFFLDEVTSGEHGQVDLTVSLEGETQGNVYQDTLAQLQMNFAVETATTPSYPVPTPTPTPTATPEPGTTPQPTPVVTPTPTPTDAPPEETPGPGSTPTPTPVVTPGPTPPSTPPSTPRVRYVYKTIPQTSDSMNYFGIAALCGVSGAALLVVFALRVRKHKKDANKKDNG